MRFWLYRPAIQCLDSFGAFHPFIKFLRRTLYRALGCTIGEGTILAGGVTVNNNSHLLSIGNDTYINRNVFFDPAWPISIGQDCLIGFNTVFTNFSHDIRRGNKPLSTEPLPIVIHDHVWLACNVTVVGGVTIGENSVVAAGSVVTRDVPPNVVVAGVPARIVREIPPDTAEAERTLLLTAS